MAAGTLGLHALKEMFAAVDQKILVQVLEKCGGNVDLAIDQLLQIPSTAQPDADVELTQEAKDALYARQLAQQLNGPYEAESGGCLDAAMSIGDFLQQFGAAEQAEMLRSIRDRAVPLVAEQLGQLSVAPVEAQLDTAQGAQLSFVLEGLRLADVELPRDRIACSLEGGAIKLQLVDISAQTQPFSWRYQRERLTDAGSARASIQQADVTLLLELAGTCLGDSTVQVRDCRVRIGDCRVDLGGTTLAGPVHAALLSAFEDSLKRALAIAIDEHLRRTVPAQAAELFTDDDDSGSSSSGSSVA